MKVLFDFQTLISQKYGGVSRYHCELRKELDKINDVVTDIPVLFSQNFYFENEYGIKAVSKYPPKTQRLIRTLNHWNTYLKCRKNHYDIIHPTWYDPYLLGHIGTAKLVVTIHDMIYEIYPDKFSKQGIENRKRYIFAADKVIAVSENTKRDILRFYPEIIPDKIAVIYESSTLVPQTEPIQGLPLQYILFVGARKGYKNFDIFYQAIVPLLKQHEDLYLVCVGGDTFTQLEMGMLDASGVSGKVRQYCLTDAQLNTAYRKALCFVYPSKYEGFGLPILEAMGNGCPCIVSNASCFPEVAGNAAIYFNPEDKDDIYLQIKKVIDDSSLRQNLKEAGKRQYDRFSWREAAHQLYDVYSEVLKN